MRRDDETEGGREDIGKEDIGRGERIGKKERKGLTS